MGDWTGYEVVMQGGDGVEISWAVTRESDGTGLGAYASLDAVDAVIAGDRSSGSAGVSAASRQRRAAAWPRTPSG